MQTVLLVYVNVINLINAICCIANLIFKTFLEVI